jgi:integrase
VKERAKEGALPNPRFLVDLHFHDLRHEAASRLFEKGLKLHGSCEHNRHKTLQTLKRYTHLLAEELALKTQLRFTFRSFQNEVQQRLSLCNSFLSGN